MVMPILRLFGFLFTWATLGAFMCVIGLWAVFWVYGRDLPDHEQLLVYEPAMISRVYSGEGKVMDEFVQERRLFTPIEDIPDLVRNAFISAEDKTFYANQGFDPRQMAAALYEAIQTRGEKARGASTITQQVMKNFLLDGSREAERKVKELILAYRVTNALSKEKILELYLNEIYLGANSYGVTAAARTYFNKTLDELGPGEVAYLAALPQRPAVLHPVRQRSQPESRRNYVLREMAENGYIGDEVAQAEMDAPLRTVQSGDMASASDAVPPRDYFTEEIRRQISTDFGEEALFKGGYSVRATMEPDLQDLAAAALRGELEDYDRALSPWRGTASRISPELLDDPAKWRAELAKTKFPRDITGWNTAVVLSVEDRSARIGIEGIADEGSLSFSVENGWAKNRQFGDGPKERIRNMADMVSPGDVLHVKRVGDQWTLRQIPELQGAFMAMDTRTGRVLAMQGGFSYQDSVFNRATQAARQPGSSFKPFVYAAALDSGYTPATIVVDAPIEVNTPEGLWRPKNASNKYYGPAPLRTGIEQSRNLMTVRIAQDIGMDQVARYAERFGVYDDMPQVLSYSLGAGETTLYQMVAAYAMFANGGERVQPTLVDRVQDRWGRTVYRHDLRRCIGCSATADGVANVPQISWEPERVMDAVTAYQLTSMMTGVVERGTASKTVKLDAVVAGKTGTTNDAKDVWFIGFTPNIVAGCYMGFDTPRSLGERASGGGMCGPVFQAFMKKIVADQGNVEFAVPPNTVFVKIDRNTGERLSDGASGDNVVAELFRIGEEPGFGLKGPTIDGGFVVGSNFLRYSEPSVAPKEQTVKTSTGKTVKLPPKATFGTLSSGGLY